MKTMSSVGMHSAAPLWLGVPLLPCFVEHLAVVYEPASDWGASVGMHSTAPMKFGFLVCGLQNDVFRPRIR